MHTRDGLAMLASWGSLGRRPPKWKNVSSWRFALEYTVPTLQFSFLRCDSMGSQAPDWWAGAERVAAHQSMSLGSASQSMSVALPLDGVRRELEEGMPAFSEVACRA